MLPDHDILAIYRNHIGDQPSAGRESAPTPLHQAWRADAAADEYRVRTRQFCQSFRCIAGANLDLRCADRSSVISNESAPLRIAFDSDRPGGMRASQPVNGDRPATGADIPEPLAWQGRQSRQ